MCVTSRWDSLCKLDTVAPPPSTAHALSFASVPAPQAFEDGMSKEELFELTNIDPWWLAQLEELHTTGEEGGCQQASRHSWPGLWDCSDGLCLLQLVRRAHQSSCKQIQLKTYIVIRRFFKVACCGSVECGLHEQNLTQLTIAQSAAGSHYCCETNTPHAADQHLLPAESWLRENLSQPTAAQPCCCFVLSP